jgi:membrane protein YqaA with SNARE-associated domain
MNPRVRLILLRSIAFIFVIGISVFVFLIRDKAEQLQGYGYLGIFFVAFLAYATVLLPAPGIAIVFTWGSIFHPAGVALAAGAGAALGEITGYLAGFSGQTIIERAALYKRLSGFMQKNGPLTIFLLSALPNPFFDLAGAAAGALKMPLSKFLFWCWIGETTKMFLFAYAGATSLRWIFN